MEAKKIEKTLKLQYKRLEEVLKALEKLDSKLLEASEDGHGFIVKDFTEHAVANVWAAMGNIKSAIDNVDCSVSYQDIHALEPIQGEGECEETALFTEVSMIRIDYPFRIDHKGSYNVYEIKPTMWLHELIAEIKKVFIREYEAGNCIAPHGLGDFEIVFITVHRDHCATVFVDSME